MAQVSGFKHLLACALVVAVGRYESELRKIRVPEHVNCLLVVACSQMVDELQRLDGRPDLRPARLVESAHVLDHELDRLLRLVARDQLTHCLALSKCQSLDLVQVPAV